MVTAPGLDSGAKAIALRVLPLTVKAWGAAGAEGRGFDVVVRVAWRVGFGFGLDVALVAVALVVVVVLGVAVVLGEVVGGADVGAATGCSAPQAASTAQRMTSSGV